MSQFYKVILSDKLDYNERFSKFIFELKEPHHLSFEAGQYMSLHLGDKKRDFYLSSSPEVDHGFEILVDKKMAGSDLLELDFGVELEAEGPKGDFGSELGQGEEVILVATQIGIAPMVSMVKDLLQNKKDSRRITLYWGLDKVEDLFLQDELEELVDSFSNFQFHPVMSQAIPAWNLCRGSVLDCVNVHQLNLDSYFYLCLEKELLEKMSNFLVDNGVKSSQIKRAVYY